MKITCQDWRPLHRNTLRGFAIINIKELRLTIRDVACHEKNGQRWAQPPAKPQIKDGTLVTDTAGKLQYSPVLEFDSRAVRDAFSRAVVAAVLARDPAAFVAATPAVPASTGQAKAAGGAPFDDEVPWLPERR
jgi:hypothetical protein